MVLEGFFFSNSKLYFDPSLSTMMDEEKNMIMTFFKQQTFTRQRNFEFKKTILFPKNFSKII